MKTSILHKAAAYVRHRRSQKKLAGIGQARDRYAYHSQLKQDKWVAEVLFPGLRNGFFLDIGAFDGITMSNTYCLEHALGWQGICVEPNDHSYAALIACRRCRCENSCIADRRGSMKFINKSYVSGLMADFTDRRTMKEEPGSGNEVVEKKVITAADLLEKHKAPALIHYMSLDVEGAEFEILKDFPFRRYAVLSLTVEHNAHTGERKNALRREAIRRLMKGHGYSLAVRLESEDWFVHGMLR